MRLPVIFMAAQSLILLGISVMASDAAEKDYTIHQSVMLRKASDGVDGYLQLLEDARLTPELRKDMWIKFNDPLQVLEGNVSKDDPLLLSFEDQPVRNARLRLVDAKGS